MRTWCDEARDHARRILTEMLLAVNPQTLLRQRVHLEGRVLRLPDGSSVDLGAHARVRVAAVGKAAGGFAAHAQPWGPFADALVVAPYEVDVPGFDCVVGTHPEPGEGSVRAGERLLEMARATAPDDLLVLLLSGGASALAEAPAVPLDDLRRATRLLLASGAPIGQVNTVRRHLSRLKGGGLARACRGRLLVLALSDVARDEMAAIGSGPASADPTTFDDALDVLHRAGILDAVPSTVRDHLRRGARGEEPETLKPGDPALARVKALVLAGNEDALMAGARAATALGYEARLAPERLAGEARECGRSLAESARRLSRESARPVALLAGGETVVRVQGGGKGGRSQEVALAAVDGLSALDAVLACMGTDGVDGPTDAAGAIVDGRTRARAEAMGLDAEHHLQENDAYRYFEPLRDLVRTGPTGTNVRDVAVLLVRGGGEGADG